MFLPFSQRGKTWEPKALELRRVAAVSSNALLDPWALAPKIGLAVVDASEALLGLLDEEERTHLLGRAGRKWSGGVLPIPLPDGRRICILNPTHSYRRNKVTLMEEISHIHLSHAPTQLIFNGGAVTVRDFNAEQEEEAYGIGAAALLPWHSFFHRVNDGMTAAEIADTYDVTEDLVKYRIKICGAYALFRSRQRALSGGG